MQIKIKGPVAGALGSGGLFEQGFLLEGIDDDRFTNFLKVLDYQVNLLDVLRAISGKDLLKDKKLVVLE